jgi:hypothetical protein
MSSLLKRLLTVLVLLQWHAHAESLVMTRAEYLDRVSTVWHGQIITVSACFPFEHQIAFTKWIDSFPKPYQVAPVDDDWYSFPVKLPGKAYWKNIELK